MVGTKYASEKRVFTDIKSGARITQLTNRGINFHFYFTENSFDLDGETIYFLSNRGHEETEIFNLFKMNLESGEMVQLTDEPKGIEFGKITKTPDSEYIAYVTENNIHLYNTKTRENKLIYADKEHMLITQLSFSCDKQWIGLNRNEDVDALPDGGPNYAGFKEKCLQLKMAVFPCCV